MKNRMSLHIKAFAKINLFLDILCKRNDGFHEVKMVMQSVSLADDIYLEYKSSGIELIVDGEVPDDSSNLAYKAALLLQQKYHIEQGVLIRLKKTIPVAAGLAGGSADAAAVLKGLNQLWNLSLSTAELMSVGAEFGSDIPFCISCGTKLAVGRGERLEDIREMPFCYIVLVKPVFAVSTAWAYQAYSSFLHNKQPLNSWHSLHSALASGSLVALASSMENVLEKVAIEKYPQISELKSLLCRSGALGAMMSGSGPTVFGLFTEKQAAEKAAKELNVLEYVESVFVVEPIREF